MHLNSRIRLLNAMQWQTLGFIEGLFTSLCLHPMMAGLLEEFIWKLIPPHHDDYEGSLQGCFCKGLCKCRRAAVKDEDTGSWGGSYWELAVTKSPEQQQ